MNELETAEVDSPDSAGEDYLLQQLKETVLRRQASMGRVHQAYEEDPRARRSATSAGLRAHISQPGMYGVGTPTYGPMFDAMDAQEKFLFENKVSPDLLQLKEDDADPFSKLLSKVQSNKAAKARTDKNDGWQLVNSNDGGIQRVHVATGKTEHLMSGSIYAKQKASAAEAFFNQLAKQNSGASVEEMRVSAEVMAERSIVERINSAMGGTGAVGVPLPIGSGQRQPPGSALATVRESKSSQYDKPTRYDSMIADAANAAGIDPVMFKRLIGTESSFDPKAISYGGKDLGYGIAQIAKVHGLTDEQRANPSVALPFAANLLSKYIKDNNGDVEKALQAYKGATSPNGKLAMNGPISNVLGAVAAPLKAGIEFAPTRTPQQLAVQESLGKAEAADYQTTKESMAAWALANQSLIPMESILLSGKHTSGVMHESLNKVGGYLNILDPQNSLAQSAGNDAAYLNRLMGLVRVDIKALGAGTAVSNLDLIVSQKAAGDLRNTPQGNLKNIGLVKLYNATNAALAQKKVDYFDNEGTMKRYKASTEPTHAVRATRNPYKDGTIMSYDVQDKASWIKEQEARNPGRTIPPEVMDREWKRFADDSVRAMFK